MLKPQSECETMMQASGKLLELDKISMHFGGVKAIDSLSFELEQGEILGIIGPNGAGKTTVLNVLTGVYIPTAGSIRYKNSVINKMPPHEIINHGIARTFQNIRVFSSMNVEENVKVGFVGHTDYNLADMFVGSKNKVNSEQEIGLQAKALLEQVGLDKKAKQPASSLSYGEQRRLEIARALACKPEILLLDEPAAGMNPNEIDSLNEMILLVKDKFNLSIILIEHQMRLIMGICSRILVMNFGKPLACGSPKEIRNNREVLEAYLGKAFEHEKSR
ncbi:MAG: ABC transporter ATP-binding protein [Anaerolineaceae bacterium]|nr:ABC transporter ATP-binding protein [Anaerolineaceae bacterium]